MAWCIFVGSKGYPNIPHTKFADLSGLLPFIFSLASSAFTVSYIFRRNNVRVCTMPPSVVCICPSQSLKHYMVRSARRRFVWSKWCIVGYSPSGLSAFLLSSRIFCSPVMCSRTRFVFRQFNTGRVLSLGVRSLQHILHAFLYMVLHCTAFPSVLGLFTLE